MASITDVSGHDWLLKLIELRIQDKISLGKFCVEYGSVFEMDYDPKYIPSNLSENPKQLDGALTEIYNSISLAYGEPPACFEKPKRSLEEIIKEFKNFDFSKCQAKTINHLL